VDLSRVARAIAQRLHETDPGRDVEVVVADGLVVEGDAHLLAAVLENLLGNAWKFTSQRARARIEVGVTSKDGQLAYFVRDDGVGFDMSHAGKLFGAFQRLHAASEFPGSGIGLATVQRIVRRHDGEVWAESQVDGGATFYFTLNQGGQP
jgi:light-regulated signal transduction histidine kinase (bacteriophytochrome)